MTHDSRAQTYRQGRRPTTEGPLGLNSVSGVGFDPVFWFEAISVGADPLGRRLGDESGGKS